MSDNNKNDGATGCVIWALIAVFAMPLVGIYMIGKGDEGQKVIGILLTIVGVIIWCFLFGGN